MTIKKQVDKTIYEFERYMPKSRWCSVWHQLDELQNLSPTRVLEVGPGPGLFKKMASAIGVEVETLDIDPELRPDHVGSIDSMPFSDKSYDMVCAFQVLEHLPYELSLAAFNEMIRVTSRYIVISLPDAQAVWRYQLHIPKYGPREFLIPRPRFRAPVHKFDGEHYWEINKRGYELSKVLEDLTVKVRLVKTYRVPENSWHRFFVFKL